MKIRINLYGDEFRPRRQWGTLPQMALAWGLCLLVLVTAQLTLQHLQSRQRADNQQQELTLNALRSEGERLLAEQAKRQPDAELSRQNKALARQVKVNQQLLTSLAAREMLKSNGFAQLLADLARIGSQGIALQHIQFDEGRISLSGLARNSQDVPAWVSRFAETEALADKPFAELEIARDGEGGLAFQLRSPEPVAAVSAAVTTQTGKKP